MTHRFPVARFARRALFAFLAPFATQPVTMHTARLWAKVQGKPGGPLGLNDAWIAATALQLRIPVLGRDAAYGRVPGLRYESY